MRAGARIVSRLPVFLARRIAAAVLAVVGMITLTFAIFWAIPSQPEFFVYPLSPHLTPYQLQHADHLLGLDQSKLHQYVHYLWRLVHGDLGVQWDGAVITPAQTLVARPVSQVLFPAAGETLSLVLGGALLVVLLAVPLGALAGSRVGTATDRTITLVTLVGICTHPMVVGLILRSVAGSHQGWLPPTGYCPLRGSPAALCSGPASWASHLVLPWITFALLYVALYTRMIRHSVDEVSREGFVRTARAKGASELRVVSRHALPNASLRVLTMIGMEIGAALGIAIYIESAFALNGLGRLALQAIAGSAALDLPLILGIVTLLTTIVVVGNVLVDLLYVVVDPRVGARFRGRQAVGRAGVV